MKYEKPDGTIEFGMSGCCCPPGERKPGMHTNCGTSWWRIDCGPWQGMERGSSHARTLAGAAVTAAEFTDAMKDEPNE